MAFEFDIIIVGGGTAGLVLAARPSEDPDTQVLVLEAGHDLGDDPRVSVPGMWPQLQGTEADWQLKTAPRVRHAYLFSGICPHGQPSTDKGRRTNKVLSNHVISIPQGRLLGGSSALNATNFVVGARQGLDAWVALGNPGWEWERFPPNLNKAYTVTTASGPHNNGAIQTNVPSEETKRPQIWRDTLAPGWLVKRLAADAARTE
jgi:choline dehydrogenase-like flavoprotein